MFSNRPNNIEINVIYDYNFSPSHGSYMLIDIIRPRGFELNFDKVDALQLDRAKGTKPILIGLEI